MKNKLPIKYKDNLFVKIKKFFSNVLKNNSTATEQVKVIKENEIEINTNESEFDKIKLASNRVKIKEDILILVEKNPKLIETLSIDKLKELNKMYDEIIERNDRKIKRLKREIV